MDLPKKTAEEVSKDHPLAFAGNLTYKGLFALIPLFTLLLSLLGMFNAQDLVETVVQRLSESLSGATSSFVQEQLLSIAGSQATGALPSGPSSRSCWPCGTSPGRCAPSWRR